MFSLIVLFCLALSVSCKEKGECACIDAAPDGDFSCLQQKLWNKCSEQWMIDGKYCEETCNRCSCESTAEQQVEQPINDSEIVTNAEDVYESVINANVPQLPKQVPKKGSNNIDKLQDLVVRYGTVQVPEMEEDENVDQFTTTENYSANENDVLTEEQFLAPAPEEEISLNVQESVSDSDEGVQAEELQAAAKRLAGSVQMQEAPIVELEEAAVLVPDTNISPKPVTAAVPAAKEIKTSVMDNSQPEAAALAEFRKPADDNPLLVYGTKDEECTPLSSVLSGVPGLQQFYRLLNLLDYGADQWGTGLTLFAPIDIGVANFLRGYDLKIADLEKMDEVHLSSLRTKFEPIVRYHFIDSSVTSSAVQMLGQIRLESRFAQKLVYARKNLDVGNSGFELIDGQGNKCNVLIADRVACEGIVHMVGCMLIPDL
eukprot:TRINITY_DN5478_c1_g1_i2.p1 TRINITY_DN5478_c1_g1~~TRINITY_DN5478_c1_g1_i2.p1  ORF type:complete len:429 (-),score=103.55 TRINITY_DN5478_c1_g1_i2:511-1797(-)